MHSSKPFTYSTNIGSINILVPRIYNRVLEAKEKSIASYFAFWQGKISNKQMNP